jgi:negative regulator of flagellin synthesis FlgM
MAISNINGSSPPPVRDHSQTHVVAAEADKARESKVKQSDQVQLSAESLHLQDLQNSLTGTPKVDTKRVEALREAIATGAYQVDTHKVAERLLDLEGELFGQ